MKMRTRNQTSITDFGGVDLSSPVLEVSSNRAIRLSNFVKKNNINQKRSGWEQVGEAPTFKYNKIVNGNLETITNPTKFNGIKEFYAEDGEKHIIAHIGNCLFECTNIKDYSKCDFKPLREQFAHNSVNYYTVKELINDTTEMFTGGNRLYILGGNKYMCLRFYIDKNDGDKKKWELFNVEDSKYTYVPVTRSSITYTDSPVQGGYTLDDVNLLHTHRKNKMISGTLINRDDVVRTVKYYEYQLDTNINFRDDQSTEDISIEIEYR